MRPPALAPAVGGWRWGSSLWVKGALITALPAVCLVGVLVGMFVVEAQAARQDAGVDQVVQVQNATSAVLQLIVDAETGVRGYVATNDLSFLEPEAQARRQLPAALDRLNLLLDKQVGHEPGGAELRRDTVTDLQQLDRLKRLVPVSAGNRPQVASLARQGKATTDAIRANISKLLRYESALESRRSRARTASIALANQLTLLAALVALTGGIGGSGLLMTGIVRRVRRMQGNAALLAAGQPLAAGTDRGTDELAALARALDEASSLIRDQRHRLELALDVGRINIWEVDRQGRMTMRGDRADEYGTTMEAGLATLRPEHAQQVREGVAGVRRDGQPRDYEVQSARDGRWFAGRLMRSSESDVIAVSVDVTALRRAQDDLREVEVRRGLDALAASEQRGRYNALVIGSAGEGIAAIDRSGRCTSANPVAAAMLGYEIADLVGQDLHELAHHSHPDGSPYDPAGCALRQTATTGQPARVDHDVFWRRDGTRLPVSYTASPLTDGGTVRGAVVTFADVSDRTQAAKELEQTAAALRGAIRTGQMVLHYQPKIDLLSGACQSVEALVRWQREDQLIYPDEFISVAESTDVIGELTDWVINTAAQQISTWNAAGLELRVAVNLSALSLTDDHIVTVLTGATNSRQVPISQLEVEITESAAAQNPEAVVAVLAKLATLNVRTAIDDFGTGFSSLSYLKHLPVSALKIDKSFVMNMPQDTRDQAIVASTIHMAHSLGMAVIAEGVENDLVLRILRRATCDTGQGYHWSRPVPAEQLGNWYSTTYPG